MKLNDSNPSWVWRSTMSSRGTKGSTRRILHAIPLARPTTQGSSGYVRAPSSAPGSLLHNRLTPLGFCFTFNHHFPSLLRSQPPFESLTPPSFLPAPQMLCEVLEALGADVLRRLQDSPPPCPVPNEPRHRSGHRSTRAIGIPPVRSGNWNRVPNRNRPGVIGTYVSCGTPYMTAPPSGGPGSLRSCKEGGGYPCQRGNNPAGHLNCFHPGMDYV